MDGDNRRYLPDGRKKMQRPGKIENVKKKMLFSQFSCAFKEHQAKKQVLMPKLTQAEVKQHQNLQHQHLTLMHI